MDAFGLLRKRFLYVEFGTGGCIIVVDTGLRIKGDEKRLTLGVPRDVDPRLPNPNPNEDRLPPDG